MWGPSAGPRIAAVVQVARRLRRVRIGVRRRHRTWMASISLATLGWGVWWTGFLLWRLAPEHAPPAVWVHALSGVLAAVGLVAALVSVRSNLAWLLLTALPLGANLSLLSMPLLLPGGGGLLRP